MSSNSRPSTSPSLCIIHGIQSLQRIISLEHHLHLKSQPVSQNFTNLPGRPLHTTNISHRGKDLVHQDAALAALVAVGAPTLPEVALVAAAKTIVEATVDLDLP